MEVEIVVWILYAALFFFLFLVSAIRYHSNPKICSQLALFALLFSLSSLLTAVGRMLHSKPTTIDGSRSWLQDPPSPMQFAFPCLSVILYNAIFNGQRQFFKFYAVVLSNYGRWSALHMNPRISKLSSNMDVHSNDMTHMNPMSIWWWFNMILLVIYVFTVVSLVCCQFIFDNSAQVIILSLSKAICASLLSSCVVLNLMSSIYARYKINLRYCLTRHPPKEEKAGFKYATSTSSSALVPNDKSKRSLLILILSPVFFLASLLTITFEMWVTFGTLTQSTATNELSTPTLSVLAANNTVDIIIECLFVCTPITFLVVLHVFYVKPYPLIVASHDINFLP